MRLRWWRSASPTGKERHVFAQLVELGQECELTETSGVDLTWFAPEEKSGSYRSISSIYTSGVDLATGGGIVCDQTHGLGLLIAAYLRNRRRHRWVQYPNDPINCFFAELLGCLSTLSLLGYSGDLELLLTTIDRRLAYLNKVADCNVFPSGFFSTPQKSGKRQVLNALVNEFERMRRNVIAARTQVTLVESIRTLDNTMTSFFHRAMTYTSQAFRFDVETLTLDDLLYDPEAYQAIVQAWFDRVDDPCDGVTQDDGATDGVLVQSHTRDQSSRDAAISAIKRVFYMVGCLASCTDTIGMILSAADKGGRPLVLGSDKMPICEWVRLNLACVEETISCIETCRPFGLDASQVEKELWIEFRQQLKTTLQTLTQSTTKLRRHSSTFIANVNGRVPLKGAQGTIEKMEELTQRTVAMFDRVIEHFGLNDEASDDPHSPSPSSPISFQSLSSDTQA
mmetsp:Transcript_142067/g.201036  ORF Transcript_142067/g.201036 Transcript_142067/m.201036 type:complete len:453 (-) Transcript_142067:32-1390(-)